VAVEVDESRSEGGSATKTHVAKDLSRDRFGNILVSLDQGDDAIADDDVYAEATYDNSVDSTWVLGKMRSLVVRSGSATGTVLRSRTGDYNAAGDITAVHVQTSSSGDSSPIATTQLGYDGFGNVVHVETPINEAGHSQTVDVTFDPQCATYPIRSTNGFGHVSAAVYDLRFGVATLETDINGSTLSRSLDGFGRLIAVRGPYDIAAPALRMDYFPEPQAGYPYPRAITTTHTSLPVGYTGPIAPDIKTVTYADGLGRAIEVRKTAVVAGVAGMTTAGLSSFDSDGRVTRAQNPFFTAGGSDVFVTSSELGTSTVYDDQDRSVLVTYADGHSETSNFAIATSPDGTALFKAQHIDANGHARETYVDLLGRTRAFVEHPQASTSSVTRYGYFATGELSRIVDAEGNQTALTYDLRGLRTELNNPDTGRIEDRFDLMGNRIATVEPNHRALGVQIHYVFDLDRLTKIDYPSKPDVTFVYGGATDTALHQVGRIKHVEDESGSRDFEYGRMGETTRTIRTVKPDLNGSQSIVFDLHTTTDSLGRTLRIGYPDGVVVTNSFDTAGNLQAVNGAGDGWTRTYATGIRYDVFGNRTRIEYGNHVVSTWRFEPARMRLENVTTTMPDSAHTMIQNLNYAYDPANNPQTITNALGTLTGGSGNRPGKSTLTLEYDGIDRLTHAHGVGDLSAQKTTVYDESFGYSASHNLLHKERAHLIMQGGGIPTAPGDTNFASDYTYDPTRPHMPKQVGDLAVTYDASGNATSRRFLSTSKTQSLVWDDDNRMVDFTSGGVHQHNTFDATGNRVRRKSTQSETLFSSAYFDVENGTQAVRHVFVGGTRVASVLGKFVGGVNPAAPAKPGTPYFFHTDRHGSTAVLTAEDASVHESLEFFPDGEQWIDRAPQKPFNHYLFSGKPFDSDTGFYDFGQRFYDPRTSLWLGVDSAFKATPSGSIARPFSLSVLSFSGNNPVHFSDPDGRDVTIEERANGVCYADASCSGGNVQWVESAGEMHELPANLGPAGAALNNGWGSSFGNATEDLDSPRFESIAAARLESQGRKPNAYFRQQAAHWRANPPPFAGAGKVLVVAALLAVPFLGEAELSGGLAGGALEDTVVTESFDAALANEGTLATDAAEAVPQLKYHYTDAPEESFKGGFYKGSSVTDDPNLMSAEASQTLGIPAPDKVIPIVDRPGYFRPGGTVDASYRYSGGGNQWFSTQRIPAEDILPARPVCKPGDLE
jgi:RHS repeat-associated protein